MSIIRVIWRSRLQWNKEFKNSLTAETLRDLTVGGVIVITTQQLTQVCYDKDYSYREDLIFKLSQEGYSNKEIADSLNEQRISPKRTDKYNAKLIWSILQKYRKRILRQNHADIELRDIGIYRRKRKA
jgi:hypothetical protein